MYPWEWSLDDWVFFGRCLNFGTILMAAIVISWTRHGTPEPKDVYYVAGLPFVRDINYAAEMNYLRDTLSDEDAAIVKQMLSDGQRLSHRAALAYGLQRPAWNRIRFQLIEMGMVEKMEDGTIVARSNLYTYLGEKK